MNKQYILIMILILLIISITANALPAQTTTRSVLPKQTTELFSKATKKPFLHKITPPTPPLQLNAKRTLKDIKSCINSCHANVAPCLETTCPRRRAGKIVPTTTCRQPCRNKENTCVRNCRGS